MHLLSAGGIFIIFSFVGIFHQGDAAQKSTITKSAPSKPSIGQKAAPSMSKEKTPSPEAGANSEGTMSTDPKLVAAVSPPPRPAQILVAYAPDSKSHLRSILPLLNRLGSAGHHIHIFHITSDEKAEKMHPNVSTIRVPILNIKARVEKEFGEQIWQQTLHSPGLAFIYGMMAENFVSLLSNNSDKIAQVLNIEWDLVITSELFNVHGCAFAQFLREHADVPYLIFSPAMMMTSAAYSNAIGQSWVTHPHPFSPAPRHAKDGFEPSNVLHRIVNVLESLGDLGAMAYINKFAIANRLVHLTGKRDFSFARLYRRSEMAMVDSIAHLTFPTPEVTEVLNVGAHCEEAGELPEDYRTFVEDPTSKGTVYVAFGTFIPWDFAPPHVVDAFFNAFERFPDYRFIFSYNGKPPERKLGSHIRLVKWAPQLDLLAHPKTKLFLTHCGLKSIKESLCTKTPMLGMPMFAEQNHNVRLVLNFGTGLALSKYNIDTEQLYDGLKEMLDNPKYGERVAKLQRIFLDRPIPELDQGEFFVRKIVEKGKGRMGRHFWKRKGIDLHFIEYFQLDLAILLFSLAFFISRK